MRGSVYRRGKGNWWIKVEMGRELVVAGFQSLAGMPLPIVKEKRRRLQQHGGRTRKEAETSLASIISKLSDGSYIEPSKLTVEAFLTKHWLPAVASTIRPSTMAGYRTNIETHIIPAIGTTLLQGLTAAHLNALYSDLQKRGRRRDGKGLAVNSVRNCHVVIRKSLGDALRWGYVARNVAEAANPPKVSGDDARHEMKAWSADELRAFLTFTGGDRLYPAWLTLSSTGMRRGELLGLRWQDVDFERASLAVRQALVIVNGELRFSTPKTSRGKRTVALDTYTVQALRTWKKAQLEERLAIGENYEDSGLVFTNLEGGALRPDSFSQTFDRLVSRAGVPRVRLHDLRHTHASLSLLAGVPVKVVSERLGHASTSFTMDIYAHVLPGQQEDAAEKVAGLIFYVAPKISPSISGREHGRRQSSRLGRPTPQVPG